ncbi:VOC family protein [Exilibacterium tricleocarpae]|uniref:VOC family protein n=1 Tax=Exilibacterium tricleocarpae TaxID=2591008 RepID=UPI0015D0E8F5|nr:VOC family protein [Exilibacterium tricleocarpae]
MIKPFHLSFVVPDLEQSREFYVNLLGCKVGRDAGTWIDIVFFGHQLTLHQERPGMAARPIDHFGPILEKTHWQSIAQKLTAGGVGFQLPPTVKGDGTDLESGKYIVKDPAGNLLEFKYYVSFSSALQISQDADLQ